MQSRSEAYDEALESISDEHEASLLEAKEALGDVVENVHVRIDRGPVVEFVFETDIDPEDHL